MLFNEAHTECLVRAEDHPVCRATENAMLQNDRMSVLCDVLATIWNAVQREEVAVICEHSMSLRWVTVFGEQLWLQQISMSDVCVLCVWCWLDCACGPAVAATDQHVLCACCVLFGVGLCVACVAWCSCVCLCEHI